jgi:hypothetical protein
MKYLYQYPQNAYPYSDLVGTNRRRGRNDQEYELLDTGIFKDDRYFDVFVEYAKGAPTDILILISLCTRGPKAASLHVLPSLWFRITWTWWPEQPKPSLRQMPGKNTLGIEALHAEFGGFALHCDGNLRLLFTENDMNDERIFGRPNATPYVKDGIYNYVVAGRQDALARWRPSGTHCQAHTPFTTFKNRPAPPLLRAADHDRHAGLALGGSSSTGASRRSPTGASIHRFGHCSPRSRTS